MDGLYQYKYPVKLIIEMLVCLQLLVNKVAGHTGITEWPVFFNTDVVKDDSNIIVFVVI